jgi:transcriptional regulator with XRE-family HTH domain
MTATKVGQALKDARLKKLWHQSELAVAANISERTVSRIEVGVNLPTLETMERLAKALEVPVSTFAQPLADDLKAAERVETVNYHRTLAAIPA